MSFANSSNQKLSTQSTIEGIFSFPLFLRTNKAYSNLAEIEQAMLEEIEFRNLEITLSVYKYDFDPAPSDWKKVTVSCLTCTSQITFVKIHEGYIKALSMQAEHIHLPAPEAPSTSNRYNLRRRTISNFQQSNGRRITGRYLSCKRVKWWILHVGQPKSQPDEDKMAEQKDGVAYRLRRPRKKQWYNEAEEAGKTVVDQSVNIPATVINEEQLIPGAEVGYSSDILYGLDSQVYFEPSPERKPRVQARMKRRQMLKLASLSKQVPRQQIEPESVMILEEPTIHFLSEAPRRIPSSEELEQSKREIVGLQAWLNDRNYSFRIHDETKEGISYTRTITVVGPQMYRYYQHFEKVLGIYFLEEPLTTLTPNGSNYQVAILTTNGNISSGTYTFLVGIVVVLKDSLESLSESLTAFVQLQSAEMPYRILTNQQPEIDEAIEVVLGKYLIPVQCQVERSFRVDIQNRVREELDGPYSITEFIQRVCRIEEEPTGIAEFNQDSQMILQSSSIMHIHPRLLPTEYSDDLPCL